MVDQVVFEAGPTELSIELQMILALQQNVADMVRQRDEWMMRFCHLAVKLDDAPSTVVLRASLTADELSVIQRYWLVDLENVKFIVLPDSRDGTKG